MIVSGLWRWICYLEAIECQGEDGGEGVDYGADGEADGGADGGVDDANGGGEERVAN